MAKKKKEKVDQTLVTERNRQRKRNKEDVRRAKLIGRTQALIGQHVAVRNKDYAKPLVGTVLEVITTEDERYPKDAVRHHGNYLKVRTVIGDRLISRHRAKLLKDK